MKDEDLRDAYRKVLTWDEQIGRNTWDEYLGVFKRSTYMEGIHEIDMG